MSRYLGIHQSIVGPLSSHELAMCTLLGNRAVLNDHDDVSILNSGQAVGNDDTSTAKTSVIEGLLNNLCHRKERSG